jgi:hypothetical protein
MANPSIKKMEEKLMRRISIGSVDKKRATHENELPS